MGSLHKLEMSDNAISSIPGEQILHLRQLTRMGLSDNKLGSFPENAHVLVGLESLDLSNNSLFLAPEVLRDRAKLPLLRDLKLDGNPCAAESESEGESSEGSEDDSK